MKKEYKQMITHHKRMIESLLVLTEQGTNNIKNIKYHVGEMEMIIMKKEDEKELNKEGGEQDG